MNVTLFRGLVALVPTCLLLDGSVIVFLMGLGRRHTGREPAAIQLRHLQTVTEIASENKSTTIFPLPLDLFKGLLESGARRTETSALALPENASGSVPAAAARS